MTPSAALSAPWPVLSEDAVSVTPAALARFAGTSATLVTVTVAVALLANSGLATRAKVTVAPAAGAVKVGAAALAEERATVGPAVCVHA